ncbi:hypothetical protein CH330_01315 [candidate division WOR-3 bacterium JGI_Cruoil_03_51_56]|uniref:Uncharacterized protein n=1 Tax=candidate division WOR-3 bacterium JGI_Cruoil_03_51_56 TaxID=1973747 RepID=A0A235BZH1_UNCW3|nr:MAG: hypothetical protein CH330_01315 [candidate division WOR-3 bacterium JGI_Cruoil_03_51_56]
MIISYCDTASLTEEPNNWYIRFCDPANPFVIDTVDKIDYPNNLGSISCLSDAVKYNVYMSYSPSPSIDLSGQANIEFWFKTDDPLTADFAAKLRVNCPDWENYITFDFTSQLVSGEWTHVILPIASGTITGSPNLADVSYLRLEITNRNEAHTYKLDILEATAASATVPVTVMSKTTADAELTGIPFIQPATPPNVTPFTREVGEDTLFTLQAPATILVNDKLYTFNRYEFSDGTPLATDNPLAKVIYVAQTITAVFKESEEILVFETDCNGSFEPMRFYGDGSYVFADPVGLGRNGVELTATDGRASLLYQDLEAQFASVRLKFQASFPDFTKLRNILYISHHSQYGGGSPFVVLYLSGTSNRLGVVYWDQGGESKGMVAGLALEPNVLYEFEVVYKAETETLGYLQVFAREVYPTPTLPVKGFEKLGITTSDLAPYIDSVEVGEGWAIGIDVSTTVYYVSLWQTPALVTEKTITGTVTDMNTGAPLADVCVALGQGSDTTIHTPVTTARTDAQGAFAMAVSEVGLPTYIIEAFRPDYYEKNRELFVFLEGENSVVKDFALAPKICCVPSDVYQGNVWPCRCACIFPYWFEYDSTGMDDCLDDLKAQIPHVNTIDIRRLYEADPANPNKVVQSPGWPQLTFAKLLAATQKAKVRGYRVRLGLVCYGNYPTVGDGVTYFDSFKQFAVESAEWCQLNGVEELCIAWESYWIDPRLEDGTFNAQWQAIIDACREAAPNVMLTWQGATFIAFEGANATRNTFLSSLDYLSISLWSRLTYNVDATYEELLAAFSNAPDEGNLLQRVADISANFNKKVMMNFGYARQWAAILRPWGGGLKLPDDEGEQAIAYKAWFDAYRAIQDSLYGVLFEHFDDPMTYGTTTGTCRNCYASMQGIIDAGLVSHTAVAPPPPPPPPIIPILFMGGLLLYLLTTETK